MWVSRNSARFSIYFLSLYFNQVCSFEINNLCYNLFLSMLLFAKICPHKVMEFAIISIVIFFFHNCESLGIYLHKVWYLRLKDLNPSITIGVHYTFRCPWLILRSTSHSYYPCLHYFKIFIINSFIVLFTRSKKINSTYHTTNFLVSLI